MNQIIIYILMAFGLLNIFFFGVRNTLVFEWRAKSRNAISRYCDDLIINKKYNVNINYYTEMQLEYNHHVFYFWLWGEKSGIKKEHRNILEKYF